MVMIQRNNPSWKLFAREAKQQLTLENLMINIRLGLAAPKGSFTKEVSGTSALHTLF